MRNVYRDFRLDRILAINPTKHKFDKRHPPFKHYLDKLYESTHLHEVIIRFEKQAIPYLFEQKYYNGYVTETLMGDEVEMVFLTPSLEGFACWYLMYGDMARIIKPNALAERVKDIARCILQLSEQKIC